MQPFHLATQALGDPTHTTPPLAPFQQNTSLPAAKFSIHSGVENSFRHRDLTRYQFWCRWVLARQWDWGSDLSFLKIKINSKHDMSILIADVASIFKVLFNN